MSPEVWQSLGAAIAFVVIGAYTTIKARSTDRKAVNANLTAVRAEKQTRSEDGLSILEWLTRIEGHLIRVEAKVDRHTELHAAVSRCPVSYPDLSPGDSLPCDRRKPGP